MSQGIAMQYTAQTPAPQRATLGDDENGDRSGMDDCEADKAAIMAVLKAETNAWLHRDFEALAQHWVQAPQTRRMMTLASHMVARRIELAEAIYHLSPAQVRLARLIVDGHDLAAASDILGVSVNTLRTHLQRIFDKIGVRNQAALVRTLLSVEVPTT